MAYILCIDTSTDVGSVAFSEDGKVLFDKVCRKERSHATTTGVDVDEILTMAAEKGMKPHAVAVCSGPGSYTGLRIGVSLAKGLCYGYEIPLIAVDTLKVMAAGVMATQTIAPGTLLCPMIDARRMEVYHAVYDNTLSVIRETAAKIIDTDSFKSLSDYSEILFFGNGSNKCHDVLTIENARFLHDIVPLASNLAPLAHEAFVAEKFENVAYFEPFYLKDFVATVPKNKF
jgi:tRNA threonylcarbamoyladenosine biosynthesis protein TsaB